MAEVDGVTRWRREPLAVDAGWRGGQEAGWELRKRGVAFHGVTHRVRPGIGQRRGDKATSRCILFNPMGLPDGKGGMVLFIDGAYYNDELVRTAQGWRMAKRAVETAYTTRSHAIMPPS